MDIFGKTLTTIAKPLLIIMIFNLASCGTFLYPERHNQKAGLIDPAVVLLDGIGLFFFVIPGVIAFAVDFTNHSIYLPHGHSLGRYWQIHFNDKLDKASIEQSIRAQTGKTINLQQSNIVITRLNAAADLDSRFEMVENSRIALAQ